MSSFGQTILAFLFLALSSYFSCCKKKKFWKNSVGIWNNPNINVNKLNFMFNIGKKNNNLTLIFVLYFCCWNKQTFSSNVYLMISWLCVFSFDQIRKLNQFVSSISENSPNFSFYFFCFCFWSDGECSTGRTKTILNWM